MHYTVMVVLDKEEKEHIVSSVEKRLAPFSAHTEVEGYISVTVEDIAQKQQMLQVTLKEEKEKIKAQELNPVEGALVVALGKDLGIEEMKPKMSDNFYIQNEALIMSDTVLEFAKGWYGEECLDEEGNVVSTYNPKAQWDWYVIGGRWSGLLQHINGKEIDYGQKKVINWHAMNQKALREAEKAWKEIKASDQIPIQYLFSGYKQGMSRKEFIDMQSAFSTYAVLTKKGEWIEKEMDGNEKDWDTNFKNRFLDTIDEEDIIVIVDCHM